MSRDDTELGFVFLLVLASFHFPPYDFTKSADLFYYDIVASGLRFIGFGISRDIAPTSYSIEWNDSYWPY